MPRVERDYKPGLHDRITKRFPGCVILILDAGQLQGIPDTLVLYGGRWAALEVKRKRPTRASDFRPNQPEWLAFLNDMSYAACVFPENEEDVLNDLEILFAA